MKKRESVSQNNPGSIKIASHLTVCSEGKACRDTWPSLHKKLEGKLIIGHVMFKKENMATSMESTYSSSEDDSFSGTLSLDLDLRS